MATRNSNTETTWLAFGLALVAWALPLTFILLADHPAPKDGAERWIGTDETWTDRFLIVGGWATAVVALGFGIVSLRRTPRSSIAWDGVVIAALYAIPPIIVICGLMIAMAFR